MGLRIIPDSIIRRGGRGGGLRVFSPSITYLLRDQFTTSESAPLTSPRTCEPGPGALTLTQTDGEFSISSSKLNFPAQTTPAFGDQNVYVATAYARRAGRVLLIDITRASGIHLLGWWIAAAFATTTNQHSGLYANGNNLAIYTGSTALATLTAGTLYQFALIQRASGMFILVRGGAFSDWTLVYVDGFCKETELYAAFVNYSAIGTMDNFYTTDLGSPWNTEFGLATDHKGVVATGDTITQTADAIVDFTWTVATGETLDFMVRRTDDNNCWIVRCDQSNSTVKLFQKQTGTETERGTAAYTWVNAVPYQIRVVCVGDSITVVIGYSENVNADKITYASASFNNTATGVKVSGFANGSKLAAWPRTVTLTLPNTPDAGYNDGSYMAYGDSKSMDTWQDEFNVLTGLTESVRIARSGYTVFAMQDLIVSDLATTYDHYPLFVMFDLGANELLTGSIVEANWKADAGDIIDRMHAKFTGATIYVARPWVRGQDALADLLAGWIATVVAARSWCALGIDERIVLKGSDNGTTYTSDGVHPNAAGEAAMAAAWKTVAGL